MSYLENYNYWLNSQHLFSHERHELLSIKDDENEIRERFFASLTFGTAGLRGICQLGINRMNRFVIAHATQAFADFLKDSHLALTSIVCYDSRLTSYEYAKVSACVLAANGIKVKFFKSLRPTPELSFALQYFGASCGINITASHNPKEYNGYKIYCSDGSQLPTHQCDIVAEKMNSHDIFDYAKTMDFELSIKLGLITFIDDDFDQVFIDAVLKEFLDGDVLERSTDLKVVYTPFHGAGAYIIPKLLTQAKLKNLYLQKEQMIPDGNFPYVPNPNPESPESYKLSIDLAKKVNAHLIIATDPDCDRIGVMVRDKNGQYVFISGNQFGILLLEYLLDFKKRKGQLNENSGVVTTVVTSMLIKTMAKHNNIQFFETFTGFKHMAEKIAQMGHDLDYILAFEEAFGYMAGQHVRDKDATFAALLITQLSAHCLLNGIDILDYLENIYKKYGYHYEHTLNIFMNGADGFLKMENLMSSLRFAPPSVIANKAVRYFNDYKTGVSLDLEKKYRETLDKQGLNVLLFILSDGNRIAIRPSGTEPKIKIYLLLKGEDRQAIWNLSLQIEEDIKSIIKQYSEA